MARTQGWTYGDSHSQIPCEDRRISCDRLIARALYDLGFRDQRAGGEVCSTLDSYLTSHGWTKVTRKKRIKAGAVVAVRDRSHSYIDHVFFVARYYAATDHVRKYDCGSNERIRTVQPFKNVPLVEWPNKVFVCAWNPPAWLATGKPGRFIEDGVDYSPVFNSIYYRKMNPDVAKTCRTRADLFRHFLNFGMSEGRMGCADFDVWSYKERHPELQFNHTKSYYREYCLNGG